ncbi:MAG: hypothetical protein ACJ8MR_07030 [Povalibacter sp.]
MPSHQRRIAVTLPSQPNPDCVFVGCYFREVLATDKPGSGNDIGEHARMNHLFIAQQWFMRVAMDATKTASERSRIRKARVEMSLVGLFAGLR